MAKDIHYRYYSFRESRAEPVDDFAANMTARFAMKLIEKHALVGATPDGEDSAGRQKLRNWSAEEMVQRCCDVASLAFLEFGRRDWLLEMPPPKQIEDKGIVGTPKKKRTSK